MKIGHTYLSIYIVHSVNDGPRVLDSFGIDDDAALFVRHKNLILATLLLGVSEFIRFSGLLRCAAMAVRETLIGVQMFC